jgi:hypothetical protein
MRKVVVLIGIMALAATTARRADAQFRFGANLSWADKTDFGIGARGTFGLGSYAKKQPVEGMVTFDYFFPSGSVNYWEVSGNLLYKFTPRGSSVAPYAGAGVLLGHSSVDAGTVCSVTGVSCSDTGVGLNLIGGLRFKGGPRFLPFVEGRFEAKSGSQFVLTAGAFFGKP